MDRFSQGFSISVLIKLKKNYIQESNEYLVTITYERTSFIFTFNHGYLATKHNISNIIIVVHVCAYLTHMDIVQHEVKEKKSLYKKKKKKAMAVVTSSHPHAVVLLKLPTLIVCAQVDMAGRTQGPRLMSVAMVRKLLPFPGGANLGKVLGPPQHQ